MISNLFDEGSYGVSFEARKNRFAEQSQGLIAKKTCLHVPCSQSVTENPFHNDDW